MIAAIYILSFAVMFSAALDLRSREPHRLFILGIIRILFMLLLLIGTYLLIYGDTRSYRHLFFFHVENVFALLWMVLACRLYGLTLPEKSKAVDFRWLFPVGATIVTVLAGYSLINPPAGAVINDVLAFPHYGLIYCSTLFMVAAVLFLGWRLEAFWRSLDSGEKWRYKYLAIGLVIASAVLGGSASYRLAFLRLPPGHLLLMAIGLITAFLAMSYALARHRLLNRELFVSRKVVYATITPMVFSGFFILVGMMSLLSRLFGWSIPHALQWLIIISGMLIITLFALSGRVRRNVKYFISTNFYINKYEYRDEWLAFSDLLYGKLTEKGVVEALYQILQDSLYTHTILIWLGNIQKGFRPIDISGEPVVGKDEIISGNDPIVVYLHNAPYLYSQEGDADPLRQSILIEKEAFLEAHGIVLMVPLILGNQCVGLIGLGPETTGGRYGHDDFDLLAALSSHAASAILAVQNAEKLAQTREQSAWSNLSAFVLHDIKNAATMLDLVRENAPQHMDNPEFQQDMLASIDDALKRMSKVQTRLSALKGEMVPDIRPFNLHDLLNGFVDKTAKKLHDLEISLTCPPDLRFHTDHDLICQIFENLLINAFEAGGDGTAVEIKVAATDAVIRIDVLDSGPGIPPDLLPQALFKPFKTANANGSGIGLWQARQSVERLGGDIQVENMKDGGACFTLRFPYRTISGEARRGDHHGKAVLSV